MARKVAIQIQELIETDEELEAFLETYADVLSMIEVYSDFCGPCSATANMVRKCKLELGMEAIALGKACVDNIETLKRFRDHTEPRFLFVSNKKLRRVLIGPNTIEMERLVVEFLDIVAREKEAPGPIVPMYDMDEMTPEEIERMEEDIQMEKKRRKSLEKLLSLTLEARKRFVCNELAQKTRRLNWILFWPHNHQAHYDLYELWDIINVTVSAKETMQLTEEMAREALYQSDVDLNEACLYALTTGEALVVLFKMFESDDRDFVSLMRRTLYEDIPVPKEDVPPEKQLPPIPAYDRYASFSKTPREIRRERYNAKLQKQREEEEERQRLKLEQERLARQAAEEREAEEKKRIEDERMARLAAGLPADPEPEPEAPPAEGEEEVEGEQQQQQEEGESEVKVEGEGAVDSEAPNEEGAEAAPEEESPAIEVFDSDVEVEGEDYIPPGGLLVPGLYTPLNDLARANGLKLFFPKNVMQYTGLTKLPSEHLPPHVLVMFNVDKRKELEELFEQFPDEVLHVGFFLGDDPYTMQHVAYTVKQYEKMNRPRKHLDRLAVAVSRKRSLPLLQMTTFNPVYISNDPVSGERECLTVFPVGYGADYVDEESVEAEEIVIKPSVPEVKDEAPVQEEQQVEEEQEEGEN